MCAELLAATDHAHGSVVCRVSIVYHASEVCGVSVVYHASAVYRVSHASEVCRVSIVYHASPFYRVNIVYHASEVYHVSAACRESEVCPRSEVLALIVTTKPLVQYHYTRGNLRMNADIPLNKGSVQQRGTIRIDQRRVRHRGIIRMDQRRVRHRGIIRMDQRRVRHRGTIRLFRILTTRCTPVIEPIPAKLHMSAITETIRLPIRTPTIRTPTIRTPTTRTPTCRTPTKENIQILITPGSKTISHPFHILVTWTFRFLNPAGKEDIPAVHLVPGTETIQTVKLNVTVEALQIPMADYCHLLI